MLRANFPAAPFQHYRCTCEYAVCGVAAVMSAVLCIDPTPMRRGGGLRVGGRHQLGQCPRRATANPSPFVQSCLLTPVANWLASLASLASGVPFFYSTLALIVFLTASAPLNPEWEFATWDTRVTNITVCLMPRNEHGNVCVVCCPADSRARPVCCRSGRQQPELCWFLLKKKKIKK